LLLPIIIPCITIERLYSLFCRKLSINPSAPKQVLWMADFHYLPLLKYYHLIHSEGTNHA
jgi:hypothetical protein